MSPSEKGLCKLEEIIRADTLVPLRPQVKAARPEQISSCRLYATACLPNKHLNVGKNLKNLLYAGTCAGWAR